MNGSFSNHYGRIGVGKTTISLMHRCSGILILTFYALASLAIPIRLAPSLFATGKHALDPNAMTVGCSEASCCSSKCYLDENGIHHCVPKDGESCECGLSSKENSSSPAQILEVATIPCRDCLLPDATVEGQIGLLPARCETRDVAIPNPPPRD
jgi:hypothetical protein